MESRSHGGVNLALHARCRRIPRERSCPGARAIYIASGNRDAWPKVILSARREAWRQLTYAIPAGAGEAGYSPAIG